MKAQEVILRAIAKQITWWQASEIIGISDWQLRRRQRRYEEHGYTGLIDRRRGRVSERQVPRTTVEEVSVAPGQGRLPQELRVRGIRTLEQANRFLREEYCREFNQRFGVAASERGTASVRSDAKIWTWFFHCSMSESWRVTTQ